MLSNHQILTGIEFNAKYENTKFYAFINSKSRYYDDNCKNCKIGLNEYRLPSNPLTYRDTGYSFYKESKCHLYFDKYEKLASIKIPDSAVVYITNDMFRADKIYVKTIKDYNEVDDYFWVKIVFKNALALQYIKKQFPGLCEFVVKQNGFALQFVHKQTHEICYSAVCDDGLALQFVIEQTPDICEIAVQENGLALKYVKNPTENIYKFAIQQNEKALCYAKQTDALCKWAVQYKGILLKYCHEEFKTYELCKLAVQKAWLALEYVDDHYRTEEICSLAVQQNSSALKLCRMCHDKSM